MKKLSVLRARPVLPTDLLKDKLDKKEVITNSNMVMYIPATADEFTLFGLTLQDVLFLKQLADAAGVKPPYSNYNNNKNKEIKDAGDEPPF